MKPQHSQADRGRADQSAFSLPELCLIAASLAGRGGRPAEPRQPLAALMSACDSASPTAPQIHSGLQDQSGQHASRRQGLEMLHKSSGSQIPRTHNTMYILGLLPQACITRKYLARHFVRIPNLPLAGRKASLLCHRIMDFRFRGKFTERK